MTTDTLGPGEPLAPATGAGPVANLDQLLQVGVHDLRKVALDVTAAGVQAADPAAAVDQMIVVEDGMLKVAGHVFDLDAADSVLLLGAGKASVRVAAALEAKLRDRLAGGLIVRRRGEGERLRRVEVIDADHPIPSTASLDAGRRLMEAATRVGPRDLVITAFTGGSSALACLPPEGVPFAAKQRLHALLLDSGASIAEVNTVRKHVSALKGGRLAAAMAGATLLNLTLSDVTSDAPDLLCDPVVQDTSEPAGAIAVLRRHRLWQQVAPEIREFLASPQSISPVLDGRVAATTVLLLSGVHIAAEMAARARALGWDPVILGSTLEGEASQVGGLLGALARESSVNGQPFRPGCVLVAAGGESTVALPADVVSTAVRGGPNQQLALAFARSVDARYPASGAAAAWTPDAQPGGWPTVAGAFVDSDGSDGGTDAAGGCVDTTTGQRARDCALDLDAVIAGYDAYPALRRLGDLVLTGPTGTNVSDLWTIVIGEPCSGDTRDGAP